MDEIKNEIRLFFEKMTFPSEVFAEDDFEGGIKFAVRNNDGRFLIGSNGETMAAINSLLKKIAYKKYPNSPKFFLDINEYHQQKYESLKTSAKNFAKQVRLYRKPITLDPMPAFERRIIHSVLSEYPDIATESTGVEPERRIIIKLFEEVGSKI